MSPVRSTKLTFWLAIIALVTPFIWINIGPQGIAYYGPDVPDIYIFGAYITGKDWTFWGIAFAILFQLSMFIVLIVSASRSVKAAIHGRTRELRLLVALDIVLLLLFPAWLATYVEGVINNSDGAAADLRVYPHLGSVIYLLLLLCTINSMIMAGRGSQTENR